MVQVKLCCLLLKSIVVFLFSLFFTLQSRFHNSLTNNKKWIWERSHEAYAKNYSMVFPHDEPLACRNMRKDPLHEVSFFLLTISTFNYLQEVIFIIY